MFRFLALTLSGLMVAACGAAASAPPSVPGSAAPSQSVASPSSPSPAGSSTAASTGPANRLFNCHPSAGGNNACPMAPGLYVAEIHDRYSLEIKETGWQEAGTLTEVQQDEEPTLLVNRSADPEQRVMIDTGPTGPAGTTLLPDLTGLQIGPPAPVIIGGTTGFQVDLVPSKPTELNLPAVPETGYQLDPGHTYRLIVTQLPMGDEAGVKVILIAAPTPAWSAFLPQADALVKTLRFE